MLIKLSTVNYQLHPHSKSKGLGLYIHVIGCMHLLKWLKL